MLGRDGSMRIGASLGHELIALGHEVRLMPPAYVKPYVKRGRADAADAEAICEAVTRPTMRFVAVKTVEQQAVLMQGVSSRGGSDSHRGHTALVEKNGSAGSPSRATVASADCLSLVRPR